MSGRSDIETTSGLRAVARQLGAVVPAVENWSLRLVQDHYQSLSVRQGVLQPIETRWSSGAHITVITTISTNSINFFMYENSLFSLFDFMGLQG